jgi:hypothetical protein
MMDDDELNNAQADAVAHMLPVQQRTIAEAALAGVTFLGHVGPWRGGRGWKAAGSTRLGHVGPWRGGRGWKTARPTRYFVLLPGGAALCDRGNTMVFEDQYEAAVAALAFLNRVEQPAPVLGFELEKGNEQ